MNTILLAALAIGASSLLGAGCGFLFSKITPEWNRIATAFAAGIMLSAGMFGLFVPAMELTENPLGVLAGALGGVLFLRFAGKIFKNRMQGTGMLLILALILHKFPEGMAGGIGIVGAQMTVALGVGLQNLPEGMVMIAPLLDMGMSRSRAALIALFTGLLNALGVVAGALWGQLSMNFLPVTLAFAGGAMLDVILQMLPEFGRTDAVLGGFLLMTAINMLL